MWLGAPTERAMNLKASAQVSFRRPEKQDISLKRETLTFNPHAQRMLTK
jgi:hypothetical protein